MYRYLQNNNNYIINVVTRDRYSFLYDVELRQYNTNIHDYCIILNQTTEKRAKSYRGVLLAGKKSKSFVIDRPFDVNRKGEKRNSPNTLTSRANRLKREI